MKLLAQAKSQRLTVKGISIIAISSTAVNYKT